MKWYDLNHQQEKVQTHITGCYIQRKMSAYLHVYIVFLIPLHSKFPSSMFLPVYNIILIFYFYFYTPILISKALAKSSTVNVDSNNFNEEAEITTFFVPPKSAWHVKVIKLYQTQGTLHVNRTVISQKADWSSGNLQYNGFSSIIKSADISTRMAATNLKETLAVTQIKVSEKKQVSNQVVRALSLKPHNQKFNALLVKN